MKVKCINNEHEENCLTINKIYPVIRETETGYIITDDNGMDFIYLKSRFVPVKEEIEGVNMKVRCINNYYKNDCLTIDETYPVVEETETSYTIVDDKGKTSNYYKYRFVPVEGNNIVDIASEIGELVEKKDKDYNSAFSKTLKEYGDVAYFLRIDDKLNRLKSLLLNNKDAEVNESVEDTLKDIVGYTLLMLKEKTEGEN